MNDSELMELCKKVYELTKWEDDSLLYYFKFGKHLGNEERWGLTEARTGYGEFPLYTSDYLLPRLLQVTPSIKFYKDSDGNIHLFYEPNSPDYKEYVSDTPLKALLKLVAALKEAGVEL